MVSRAIWMVTVVMLSTDPCITTGICAHPLLSATASNVLSTLVQHCEPLMASRLLGSVASLAALAASAEAVATIVTTVFSCSASGGDASLAAQEPEVAAVGFDSVSGRLERLLSSMLTVGAVHSPDSCLTAAVCLVSYIGELSEWRVLIKPTNMEMLVVRYTSSSSGLVICVAALEVENAYDCCRNAQ